jgi:hypothetical protein
VPYRSVGNRCAIDLSSIPLHPRASRQILKALNFKFVTVDVVGHARACIGASIYERGVLHTKAPAVLDCSSLVKWAWGLRGVWVPRLSIQQCSFGSAVALTSIRAGDAIFTAGCVNYFDTDPSQGVGHVGLATGEGTVIHAVGRKSGVKEVTTDSFLRGRAFRGVRRFASLDAVTVQIPSPYSIEWSDDLKWLVLSHSRELGHR